MSTPSAGRRWLAIPQDASAISADRPRSSHPATGVPGQFDAAMDGTKDGNHAPVDRPAGPMASNPAGAIADRDPDDVFASITRSIDKANQYLGQLPSAAYYRTPTTPNDEEPT